MKIVTMEEINAVSADDRKIQQEDRRFDKEIENLADRILQERSVRPIVLISGPSGSGKTTTAHKMERVLDGKGVETHVVSLDNYFRTVLPEERKTVDLESPSRVDGKLLSKHIEDLIECRPIEVPVFDFVNTKRSDKTTTLSRKKGEIVIFEGIHSLNPDVVTVSDSYVRTVYASVRTRVGLSDGELIHPKYIRLMRRACRDKLFRGRTVAETLAYFQSVEEGEKNYIMPYKHRAQFELDTFILYELPAYAAKLCSDIAGLPEETKRAFAKETEALSAAFGEAFPRDIRPANDSLIKEFLG